jgi:hypothetical protein
LSLFALGCTVALVACHASKRSPLADDTAPAGEIRTAVYRDTTHLQEQETRRVRFGE